MRLQVVAVGRLKAGPERDLSERYRERATVTARGLGFTGLDLLEVPEGKGRRAPERREEELAALRPRLAGAAAILFDEAAPSLTSADFASRLAAWRDAGRARAALVIGGPDGSHPGLRDASELTLSFGRLTLPHGLVRVLVCEQVYRALTILAGHPYHRESDGAAEPARANA